jgi:hypothetical protein
MAHTLKTKNGDAAINWLVDFFWGENFHKMLSFFIKSPSFANE